MKLAYQPQNIVFELRNDLLNSIVIEDPSTYEEFVLALYDSVSSAGFSWELLDSEKTVGKEVDLIWSPLDLSFDKRSVKKNLYNVLNKSIQMSELLEEMVNIHAKTVEVLDKINIQSDYTVDFQDDFTVLNFLKMYDVKLKEPEGKFVEKLIEYILVIRDLTAKNIFVLNECIGYLSENDLIELDKWIKYNQVYLVFVGYRQIETDCQLNEHIIDKDLCELH